MPQPDPNDFKDGKGQVVNPGGNDSRYYSTLGEKKPVAETHRGPRDRRSSKYKGK